VDAHCQKCGVAGLPWGGRTFAPGNFAAHPQMDLRKRPRRRQPLDTSDVAPRVVSFAGLRRLPQSGTSHSLETGRRSQAADDRPTVFSKVDPNFASTRSWLRVARFLVHVQHRSTCRSY
jgi:hypothetical protein